MAINKNIEISTPYYSHVKKYKTVYEPAEDTFLLLDALQEDRDAITKRRCCFFSVVALDQRFLTFFVSFTPCRMKKVKFTPSSWWPLVINVKHLFWSCLPQQISKKVFLVNEDAIVFDGVL